MNPIPPKRNTRAHTSTFQLILVALALLGTLFPSRQSVGAALSR